MEVDGINWAGWVLIMWFLYGLLTLPFRYGKPRTPVDAIAVIGMLMLCVLLVFALEIV